MVINWPDGIPAPSGAGWQFSLQAGVTATPASPFSGRVQTALRFRRWTARADWPLLTANEARLAEDMADRLNGQAGRILMPVWHRIPPRAAVGRGPWQITGSLGATEVTISGFAADLADRVPAGDFVSFSQDDGRQVLHRITGAGAATVPQGSRAVTLSSPLRGACTGTTAEMARPVCRMRLASANALQLRWRQGGMAALTMQLVEDPF